ncbi:MAG: hypothetical protein Q8L88_08700 [Bacteroidota bacterium]|nr:hypothetical protein [Bacteroidota bacterium]
MNENELHERLIDYVEGNILPEQKAEIESYLTKSPQMQNELDIIQSALNELRSISDENVPTHYFSNFLPRLRKRLESGKIHLPMFLPEWVRVFAAPVIVSVLVFSMIIMYQSFKPVELQSPIYSMVNDMERAEINSIVDETVDYGTILGIIRSVENFSGDISNVSSIESTLTEDLLVLDVSAYQTENELLSDMGDQDVEQVLELLDKPSIQ